MLKKMKIAAHTLLITKGKKKHSSLVDENNRVSMSSRLLLQMQGVGDESASFVS
jgi:hypothetical protein